MKFFLDTANLEEIREAASTGIVDGITTNPSLIAKEGNSFEEQLRQICSIIDGPVSAEAVSLDAAGMVEEGRNLARIHPNIVVKCPFTLEGLKATKTLSDENIKVNVTLIFSAPSLQLDGKTGLYNVGLYLDLLEDTEGKWKLEDVLTPTIQSQFVPSEKEVPNYGFTTSVYWARFQITNNFSSIENWLLEIGYPLIDHVELYIFKPDGSFTQRIAGDIYPFHKRETLHRNFLFHLPIAPQKVTV